MGMFFVGYDPTTSALLIRTHPHSIATRHDNLKLSEQEENFHRPSPLLIGIHRLSQSICKRGFSRAAGAKFRVFSRAFLDFRSKLGRTAHHGETLRNERKTYPKGSSAPPAYAILATPRHAWAAGKLFKIQRRQKLFSVGPKARRACGKGRSPRDGHLWLSVP